jgi:hypothetical protein
MDQPPTSTLPLLPYAQASPAQMVQAMFTAKETLGSSYADIVWPQWQEAFAYIQPLLLFEPSQVSVTAEGLVAIAQYFDTRYPVSASPMPTVPPPSIERASGSPLPLTIPRQVKRTYLLHPDVLESLERVSFWRRVGKSALVNLALMRLLPDYTESQDPIPSTEV